MRVWSRVLFFTFLFGFGTVARAEFQVPSLKGPVMDEIGLLRAYDRRALEQTLTEVNRRGIAQVQLLIVRTLSGEEIESASIKVFDRWQIGNRERDNGVLFLIAHQDRKMRIEVGRGLEGALPDVEAKRILADQVAPLFRAGRFSEGIVLGTSEILQRADKEFAESQPLAESSGKQGRDFALHLGLFFLIVLLSIMRAAVFGGGSGLRGRRGGGHWGAPIGGGWSGGGGGWSGGGGSSAGGGASSGW